MNLVFVDSVYSLYKCVRQVTYGYSIDDITTWSCVNIVTLILNMRGDGGVAGEGRLVGIPKFHFWGKCTMPFTISTQIGCPMLPLACILYCIAIFIYTSKVTAPQDAHKQ